MRIQKVECSEFHGKENHKAIVNDIYRRAYSSTPYDFKHAYLDDVKNALMTSR